MGEHGKKQPNAATASLEMGTSPDTRPMQALSVDSNITAPLNTPAEKSLDDNNIHVLSREGVSAISELVGLEEALNRRFVGTSFAEDIVDQLAVLVADEAKSFWTQEVQNLYIPSDKKRVAIAIDPPADMSRIEAALLKHIGPGTKHHLTKVLDVYSKHTQEVEKKIGQLLV